MPGSTSGRITDPVSPEPFLHLGDQVLRILELVGAGLQSKQDFGCPQLRRGRREKLAHGSSPNGNRVADIQADTTAQQTQVVAPLNQTRKQTSQLAPTRQEIIRPFDLHGNSCMLQTLRQRESKRQAQQTGTGVVGIGTI